MNERSDIKVSRNSEPAKNAPGEERRSPGRFRRWSRRFLIAVVVLAAILLIVSRLRPTAEEELAAIDKARAVTDENNAALIYAELVQHDEAVIRDIDAPMIRIAEAASGPMSLIEGRLLERKLAALELPAGLLRPSDEEQTLWSSWTSSQYPGLRQWISAHQKRIDQLMEAAAKPGCYFPLLHIPKRLGLYDVPLNIVRQHAFLLRRAANNDMAEGRIVAGLTKYQAIISIGRHFEAQPSRYHVLTGIACEAMGLHHLIVFAVTGPATEEELDALAASSSDLENHWQPFRRDINRVRNAFARTLKDHRSLKLRLYEWYMKARYHDNGWNEGRVSELYHRVLCERRAYSIVVALRRFKNRTGHWPEELDEIAPALDPPALIDPQNGGPYVYRVDQTNGFELYSAGPDSQDDRRRQGSDDWPIWPRNGGSRRQNPNESTTYESLNRVPIEKGTE